VAAPIHFDYSSSNPSSKTRLEIGLDTIRIGFVPPSMSWELNNRLKGKGWKYYSKKGNWNKHFGGCDLRVWHSEWWVGAEVALPRLLAAHNSKMSYDHVAALAKLKKLIDDDIALGGWKSPGLSDWYVNRVDVTADFIFNDATQVQQVLASMKKAKMIYRPKKYVQAGGVKWSSKAGRLACSVYDKYAKDSRAVDKGKLRLSVIIAEDSNKRMLKRYGIKMVSGLVDDGGLTWLRIVDDEVAKIRAKTGVGLLRLVVSKARAAYGV